MLNILSILNVHEFLNLLTVFVVNLLDYAMAILSALDGILLFDVTFKVVGDAVFKVASDINKVPD